MSRKPRGTYPIRYYGEDKKEYKRLYYQNNKEKIDKYNRDRRTLEGDRNTRLKRVFGITNIEYSEMLNKQNGLCAICNEKEISKHHKGTLRQLAVDHNHITGKIRGLLCSRCNLAIGSFRDNVEFLQKAIIYLNQ